MRDQVFSTRFWGTVAVIFSITLHFFGCSKVNELTTNLFFSTEEEVEIGSAYAEQIEADAVNYPLYRNSSDKSQDLIAYVDSIGQHIAATQNERTDLAFSFTLIDNDEVINAFALPGGFIYIYTGLLRYAENEAELAAVLAHEIAHVTQRHGMQALTRQYSYSLLVDLLAGDRENLKQVLNISSGLIFLQYGKKNEFEADSCAVEYTRLAGYNPIGMQAFLEVLASEYGGGEGGVVGEFLSTHPPTSDRIERVGEIIDSKGYSMGDVSLYTDRYNQKKSLL